MQGNIVARVAVSPATYAMDKPYDYRIPEALREKLVPGVRVMLPFGRGNRRVEGLVLSLAENSEYDRLKPIDEALDSSPVLSEEQIKLALWMRERFFCTVYQAVKAMLPAGMWYAVSDVYKLAQGVDKEAAYAAAGKSKAKTAALDVIFARGGACDLRELELAFGDADPAGALRALVKAGVLESAGANRRRVGDKTLNMARLGVPAEDAAAIAEAKKKSAKQQAAVLRLLSAIGRASVREICAFTGAGRSVIDRLVNDGLVIVEPQEIFRRPRSGPVAASPLPVLNETQRAAFEGILALAGEGEAKAALLFGVTGSGKTTVYIRLIDELLKKGRGSILLVPEIALTPQMIDSFSARFGETVAVLHSSLAIGERYDEWKRIRAGKARVVIGTRSAVFAPVENLGIIIIDEEQEDTYKSENAPRYHAREVAKYRCARAGALLLLGSATPDIGSRYAAQAGRYAYFALDGRYNEMALPEVRIVDMKRELRAGNGGSISAQLRDEIAENLQNGEQTILFLNRRGTNKLITCGECGYTYECSNCSVSLTWHGSNRRLICHYCGHSRRVDEACPQCGGALNFVGAGTQKVEEELKELFPEAGVIRMDADTVTPAGSHEAILSRFREERIPIMVGTQMVTKGLNFENVTLVGVISADQSLYAGSYRASERTFSLITQVVGRSGRGEKPGRAVIQTFTPANEVIRQAAAQDYERFFDAELELRRVQYSPPFSELFTITASGQEETQVLRCCAAVRDILRSELKDRADARVLGIAPLPVVRVNNRFRYRVTLAVNADRRVRSLLSDILVYCGGSKEYRGVAVFADAFPSD